MILPKYPVYIPSKGRYDSCLTANALIKDGVPFKLVVEPQEESLYRGQFGADYVLTLPFSNLDQGSIPARNWIKAHAIAQGAERHWQLDDNMPRFMRVYRGHRLYCEAGIALRACEDFTDRYENVAVSGLNYTMFYTGHESVPPFWLNVHVYSCTLVLNSIPYSWRGRYNEDTDLCLQVLSGGWCTILMNAFLVVKKPTMTMKGGNTEKLYQGDGRLRMARSLERMWPGVVKTKRRFKRPQHVVKNQWKGFDTPLKLKPGVQIASEKNEYGMRLGAVKDVRSDNLKSLVQQHEDSNP